MWEELIVLNWIIFFKKFLKIKNQNFFEIGGKMVKQYILVLDCGATTFHPSPMLPVCKVVAKIVLFGI